MESAWRELDLSYLGRQDGLGMTLTDVARIVRPKSLLLRNQKRAPEVSNSVMKANRMLVYESIPYHDSTSTMNMPTIKGKVSDRQTLFPFDRLHSHTSYFNAQIGRASCRERV